jgi:hypothetical protein
VPSTSGRPTTTPIAAVPKTGSFISLTSEFKSSASLPREFSEENWMSAILPFELGSDHPARKRGSAMKSIPVDLAPFQVPDLTSMPLLHFLFAICTYGRMYVTWQGKLVGILYKNDILSPDLLKKTVMQGPGGGTR